MAGNYPVVPILRGRTMPDSQRECILHVTWGFMPHRYPNLMNFFHGIVNHDYTFFSTMLSRPKLTDVCNHLSKTYGDTLKLCELSAFGAGHTLMIVAYSVEHFCHEDDVPNLIYETRRATLTAHRGSNLVSPDRC